MMVEDMLKVSGNFGPAQWLMLALFSLVNVLSAFHYFAQTFINLGSEDSCGNETNTNAVYGFQTIIQELGWRCDESWNAALTQSMFFVGSVVGTLMIGLLADRVGRRPMLVTANLLAVLGNLLTAYLPHSVYTVGFARFVAGLAVDSNFFMMYILVMEYISPGMRTIGLNLCIGVWYCIGCMATPWMAVLSKDWRTFLTTISAPMLIIPLCALFLPESIQWLISRGKFDEALCCFKKVSSINRKKIPAEFLANFKTSCNKEMPLTSKNGSLRGLFATPKLRKKTCILIFKTMVLTLCYDAISRNIEGLGYDPFTMFTITSATLFPSCLVILLLQDRVGRKAVAVLALLLTGVLNLVQATILASSSNLVYIGAIIGICSRFAVNIAYNSGTQYAAELIPTQVRGQGLSAIHVVGYIATFFSPHILYMSNSWIALPEVVLGVLAIAGGTFCMFLPETLGRTLPVTLEDGELFGEDDKFWEFRIFPKDKAETVTVKF